MNYSIHYFSPFQSTEVRKTRPRKVKVTRAKATHRKPRPPDGVPDLLSDLSGRKPRSHLEKSSTYDALADEYCTNSSYTPESLDNCHNININGPTDGLVIIEKLDNGTNIVWNSISSDSGLSSRENSVPCDNDTSTETDANEAEHNPEAILDVNSSDIEISHEAITECGVDDDDTEVDVKNNDNDTLKQTYIQSEEEQDEIVKEGAKRSDVESRTLESAKSNLVDVSDSGNELVEEPGDTSREVVCSDDGESDKDDVFKEEDKDIEVDQETIELTVAIDIPKDKMLCTEDVVNDNIVHGKETKGMVNQENNNNYSSSISDLKTGSKNDLNEEERIFLPRRRSSTKEAHVKQLNRDDLESDLNGDPKKKAFRSPLSSVDHLIEILATKTEQEKDKPKDNLESGPNESHAESKPKLNAKEAEPKRSHNTCDDVQNQNERLTNLTETKLDVCGKSPDVLNTQAVKSPDVLNTQAVKSPDVLNTQAVKSPDVLNTQAVKSPDVLNTQAVKLELDRIKDNLEDLICAETPELNQAAETEEKLLQSLNTLHDSIKHYTNSLKEKSRSKSENQSITKEIAMKEEVASEATCADGDKNDDLKEGAIVPSELEEAENANDSDNNHDLLDSLYEPENLKTSHQVKAITHNVSELGEGQCVHDGDNKTETDDLIDSLYEPEILKNSRHVQGEDEKHHTAVKDIPQIVNEPVFFDSNYEEVVESNTERPSGGGFFLSEFEQSETIYVHPEDGSSGEPGNITFMWAESPNRTPGVDTSSSELDKESSTDPKFERETSHLDVSPKTTFELTALDNRPESAPHEASICANPVSTSEACVYSTLNNDKRDTESEGQENNSNNLHNLSSDSLEDLTIIEPLDKCSDLLDTSSVCSSVISEDSLCDDKVDNLIDFSRTDNQERKVNPVDDPGCLEVKGQGHVKRRSEEGQGRQLHQGRGNKVNISGANQSEQSAIVDKKLQSLLQAHVHTDDMNESVSSYTDDSIELEEDVQGASDSQLSSTMFETDTTPTASAPRQPSFQLSSNSKSNCANAMQVRSKVQGHNQGSRKGHSDNRKSKGTVQQDSFYLNDSGRRDANPRLIPGSEFALPHGFVYRRPLEVEADSDSLSSDSLGDDDDDNDGISDSEIQILTEYGDQSLTVSSSRDHLECIAEEGQIQGHPQKRSKSYQRRSRSDIGDGTSSPSGYEESTTAL